MSSRNQKNLKIFFIKLIAITFSIIIIINATYNLILADKIENLNKLLQLNKKENITSYEVHIFNFNQNIYNQKITVEFIDRIREEKKFDDINALKLQLIDDQKKSIALLS